MLVHSLLSPGHGVIFLGWSGLPWYLEAGELWGTLEVSTIRREA